MTDKIKVHSDLSEKTCIHYSKRDKKRGKVEGRALVNAS